MPKSKLRNSAELLLDTIFEAMHEKKAEQVLLLDLSQIKGANFDFFVIAHGNSTTQVSAIAEEVRRKVKTICLQNPAHAEGFTNAEWILLDYLSVVVHVFQKEVRDHYQLENLWADAIITAIEEEPSVKKPTTTKKAAPAKKPVNKGIEKTPAKKTPAKKAPAKKTVKESVKKTTKTNESSKSTKSKPKLQSKTNPKSSKSKI